MREALDCECGDHSWAALTRGFVTLVSPADAGLLDSKWYAFINQAGNVYAGRKLRRKSSAYDASIILSVALQHGADVENIRKAITRDPDGAANGPIGKLLDILAETPQP